MNGLSLNERRLNIMLNLSEFFGSTKIEFHLRHKFSCSERILLEFSWNFVNNVSSNVTTNVIPYNLYASQTKFEENLVKIRKKLTKSVTLAAFLRPAGRLSPILSSRSLSRFPPSFDFARRRTPPNNEALRHSGGDSLR